LTEYLELILTDNRQLLVTRAKSFRLLFDDELQISLEIRYYAKTFGRGNDKYKTVIQGMNAVKLENYYVIYNGSKYNSDHDMRSTTKKR
jgi:hypothetical protein